MFDVQKEQQRINFLNTPQRTSLRVVIEKIGKASAVVHGDLSKEALKELLMSELSLISKTKSFEKEDIKTSLNEIQEHIDQVISKDNEKEILNVTNDVIKDHVNTISDLLKNGNKDIDKEEENQRNCASQFSKNVINKLDEKIETFERKLTEDGRRGNREKHKKNIYVKDTISHDRNFSANKKSQEILNELLIHDVCIDEEKEDALNLSKDNRWLKKYFEQPLILAMKEIVERKPSDPVNYLGFWLLNYRTFEENKKMMPSESLTE